MIVATTPEAQLWLDGCIADCDRRKPNREVCDSRAVMVIELPTLSHKVQTTRCQVHGEADIATGLPDAPVEIVSRYAGVRT